MLDHGSEVETSLGAVNFFDRDMFSQYMEFVKAHKGASTGETYVGVATVAQAMAPSSTGDTGS